MPENDPDDLSGLPANPTAEELPVAYQLCRRKLSRANRSRTALKGHDEYRGTLITELQNSLQILESESLDVAPEKLKLHALNERISEVVRDYEKVFNELSDIAEEPDAGGLSGWVVRLARMLHVVRRLQKARAHALRLLAQLLPPQTEPHREIVQTVLLEPLGPPLLPSPPAPEASPGRSDLRAYGPLVLRSLDYAFGLLLLPVETQPLPDGLITQRDSPWLPGHTLLVQPDAEDPDLAAIEAGFLAIEQEQVLFPELQPWLDRGVLPFALDPLLRLPRLVHNASQGSISHVLVREAQATVFQEQIGGTRFDLDSDHWLAFQLNHEEAEAFWHVLDLAPGRSRKQAPRLSTRGGVPMVDRHGFLATGLGLPLLTAPLACELERVQLQLADDLVLDYIRSLQGDDSESRQIWQPSPQDRGRVALAEGPARFTGWLADGSSLQRTIHLTALTERVRFQRVNPIAYREDWGTSLGPLELPEPLPATTTPSPAALQWARQRLNQGDAKVNALFEQQMLESLSTLFQRRASLQRRDFLRLYAQLRNKPDEWPGFPDAVLRGWCEGGWLEEGVERRSGRWRLQPVDPRLVRLSGGGLQLVGLLSARRLVAVVATAHGLGLTVISVPPTCADMPRGWRFFGAVEDLGSACGLPVVETNDWIPDPSAHAWIIESPLPSDSPPWPIGLRSRRCSEDVCGRRGDHHWKPAQPLPAGHRASIHLKIETETSSYGKRRWHSHDPVRDDVFSSCHRNRVALHALEIATNGLWPFGFTNSGIDQIDRLYDAEAYLPLPLARWAAITGRSMPGPTRYQPGDHTYRYHVAAALRSHQLRTRFLPLTSTP